MPFFVVFSWELSLPVFGNQPGRFVYIAATMKYDLVFGLCAATLAASKACAETYDYVRLLHLHKPLTPSLTPHSPRTTP